MTKTLRLLVVILEFIISGYFSYATIWLHQAYRESGLLFVYRVPDWIIHTIFFLSILGFALSILTFFDKISTKQSLLISFILILIGVLFSLFSNHF
jgi:hypothetical protein